MANDLGTLVRTPHRRRYMSICTISRIFGTGFPVRHVPARKPFVAVSAFLVTRRRRHRHSHRRGCARLARTAFFPPHRRVSLRMALFCLLLPRAGFALPFSSLVTTYATNSIRLSRSHHVIIHILTAASLPSLRPRARRGVPPSVLPAPYRPLMSPSLSW